jgi:hypothetical protein
LKAAEDNECSVRVKADLSVYHSISDKIIPTGARIRPGFRDARGGRFSALRGGLRWLSARGGPLTRHLSFTLQENHLLRQEKSGSQVSLTRLLSPLNDPANAGANVHPLCQTAVDCVVECALKAYDGQLDGFVIRILEAQFRDLLNSSLEHLDSTARSLDIAVGQELHSGTATYATRLTSLLHRRENKPVYRYLHGGDRALFKDFWWPACEYLFATTVVCHGELEANMLSETLANQNTLFWTDQKPLFHAVGSMHHKTMGSRTQNAHGDSFRPQRKKLLLSGGSFVQDFRHMPQMKLHDVPYFQWQRRLLQALSGEGYEVTVKRHPKGFLAQQLVFEGLCAKEITQGTIAEQFAQADAAIFDMAGSAFLEALGTTLPVVLIDVPNRQLSTLGRKHLGLVCEIVPAHFDAANQVQIDIQALVDALHEPVDVEARQHFSRAYLGTA